MESGITVVTCAIIRQGNRILAVQRSEGMPHPGKWEFPGGKVKTGESPEKCIKREIQEELGVIVKVEALLPSILHRYEASAIRLLPFICSLVTGEIVLTEHSGYEWFTLEDLEKGDLLEADRKILPFLFDLK